MNQITTRPARAAAIAQQDDAIQHNIAKIEQQRPPASALQLMASRLNVPSALLKNTLLNTVFKKASEAEFIALVIVANEYKLNPLTKEIYAFPAKGGGIVPIVSVDGWIRIMNEHPQFDGIEFKDIADDKGELLAIEATIYRRDRTRPIKVPEYLDECRQNTDPWKNMPARMLRHKALIQCARVAFGFSGIYSEDEAQQIGDIGPSSTPMPMRDLAPHREQHRAIESGYDAETGEIDEDTARELDRQSFAAMEGRDAPDMVEAHTTILAQAIHEIEIADTVDAMGIAYDAAVAEFGVIPVIQAAKTAWKAGK